MQNRQGAQTELSCLFASPQEAESWFVKILDSIYDGVLIVDKECIVRYVNPEYTRITGISHDQIIGQFLSDVRPGAVLPKIVASGTPMAGVYRREGTVEYVVDMAPIIINDQIVGGISCVKDITEIRRLNQEIKKYEKKAHQLKNIVEHAFRARYQFADIIGQSDAVIKTVQFARKIATGETDILIMGESGTGKEIMAQAMHNASKRSSGPFVALNCAALTPSLMESELFGYEDGAFTGARRGGKPGLFEIAEGGTLLLDEIGELSLEFQAKLLRVLQERTVRKVGDTGEISINVRIMASTNRNLQEMMHAGRFREDLFYRLNVLSLRLPPLRERLSDVEELADFFLAQYSRKTGKKFVVSPEVRAVLKRHAWPGNIRELRNAMEFAATMCEDSLIAQSHLPSPFIDPAAPNAPDKSLAVMMQEAEKQIVVNALLEAGSSVEGKRRAAGRLGISLATLYNKIKSLEIQDSGK